MTTRGKNPSAMFIAGEPSGDSHASTIIKNLKARCPNADIWGIGGPLMAAAGLVQAMPFEPFNRMGYVEVIRHLPFFLGAKKKLVGMMAKKRPDVLVCVDYSGFNTPMMKEARKLGIPVVWYIAPMVWAWKRKRAKVLGELASHIAVIFPFEVQYFEPYKAPVTFVGNPLVEGFVGAASCRPLPDSTDNAVSAETSSSGHPQTNNSGVDAETPSCRPPIDKNNFRLAIIPGSRPQEIKNMLGVMVDAAVMLRKKYPGMKITVSKFGRLDDGLFSRAVQSGFDLFSGPLSELLGKSDLALITSGTATLETALLGVPMVIAYRTSPLSYAIYKRFVKKDHAQLKQIIIGLPNIITRRSIVPECVQNDVTAENLFTEMDKFLSNPSYYQKTVQNLSALRAQLGEKSPSIEVANIVYSYME